MKIHESHNAPNPRRVRIFLAEKGIQVPFEEVDIVKKVNRDEEFRRKNPLGTVPVLELDDGTFISESVAICRYFEEIHPEPPLFGADAKQRALIEMWNRRMEFNLLQPIADSFRQHHDFFKGRIRQLPAYAEVQRLNQIRLAGTVGSGDHRQPGAKPGAGVLIAAEVADADTHDAHVTGYPPTPRRSA